MFKLRALPQTRLPGPGLLRPFGAANTLALDFSNLSSSILVAANIPDSCRSGPGATRCVCGAGSRARKGCRLQGRREESRLQTGGHGLPNVESPLARVL